jgi:hypothetical protein
MENLQVTMSYNSLLVRVHTRKRTPKSKTSGERNRNLQFITGASTGECCTGEAKFNAHNKGNEGILLKVKSISLYSKIPISGM